MRKPLGRGLAIGGLILSTIATITSIVMVLLVLVWLPGIDRDNAGGFGDEPVVPAPESAPASQAIDTPCYSFDGPEGYINDISTDTAEGCATELELWGELREDGTVNNTGVGAIHATVTVEPVRSATADGWGTDGTLDGLQEFLEQDYIPGMGTPLADPEPVSLGGVDAYLTRVDSTVDETKTKALLVTLAPTDYSTPNGDVGVFVVSFVTVEDNGDAIIKTLIDSWEWK